MNRNTSTSMRQRIVMGVLTLLLMLPLFASPAFGDTMAWPTYSVKVDTGYLALRTEPSYDSSNEIGELYTGDIVYVVDYQSNKAYWKVRSPKYDRTGWVNKDYLVYVDGSLKGNYRVQVSSGYLALRNAPAYDDKNEIGELYTGDVVTLLNTYSGKYWWVYSAKYNASGYVNKDYLTEISVTPTSKGDYRVQVSKGYLALRSAASYDERNEIGKLYTGDVVTVLNTSNGDYWWVYSAKYSKSGYVNKDYLTSLETRSNTSTVYQVKVASGYLALRNAPAYDERNEIAKLYTGDVVHVTDTSNSQYWWVYSPKFDRSGYVNKDYLVRY